MPQAFVVDGFDRATEGLEMEIRPRVAAEFAAELARTSWWYRWQLYLAINREVRRRAAPAASSAEALY